MIGGEKTGISGISTISKFNKIEALQVHWSSQFQVDPLALSCNHLLYGVQAVESLSNTCCASESDISANSKHDYK